MRLIQLLDEAHKQPGDVIAAGGKLTYGQMMTPAGLGEIAGYAGAIGAWKESVLPRDKQNKLQAASSLVDDAHAAGLQVVVYTFRDEPQFLADDYRGDPRAELARWFAMGIDSLFTDFPLTAVLARAAKK